MATLRAPIVWLPGFGNDPTGDIDREEFWRDFLNRGDAKERRVRRVFRVLAHVPRCQLCAAPFAGPVAPIMRAFGKRPADEESARLPVMLQLHRQAPWRSQAIEASFLFDDIRGSTILAEHMSGRSSTRSSNDWSTTASAVVFEPDGAVNKLLASRSSRCSSRSCPVTCATRRRRSRPQRRSLRATGHADAQGPWAPTRRWRPHRSRRVGEVGDDGAGYGGHHLGAP